MTCKVKDIIDDIRAGTSIDATPSTSCVVENNVKAIRESSPVPETEGTKEKVSSYKETGWGTLYKFVTLPSNKGDAYPGTIHAMLVYDYDDKVYILREYQYWDTVPITGWRTVRLLFVYDKEGVLENWFELTPPSGDDYGSGPEYVGMSAVLGVYKYKDEFGRTLGVVYVCSQDNMISWNERHLYAYWLISSSSYPNYSGAYIKRVTLENSHGHLVCCPWADNDNLYTIQRFDATNRVKLRVYDYLLTSLSYEELLTGSYIQNICGNMFFGSKMFFLRNIVDTLERDRISIYDEGSISDVHILGQGLPDGFTDESDLSGVTSCDMWGGDVVYSFSRCYNSSLGGWNIRPCKWKSGSSYSISTYNTNAGAGGVNYVGLSSDSSFLYLLYSKYLWIINTNDYVKITYPQSLTNTIKAMREGFSPSDTPLSSCGVENVIKAVREHTPIP